MRSAALLAVCVLPACGLETKHVKNNELVQQMRADEAFADDYFVDDLACQNEKGVSAVGAASVFQWQGDAARPTPYPFNATSGESSLKSGAITASSFGFYQQQECKNGETPSTCSGAARVVKEEKALKICRQGAEYPRLSIEGVALSSLASINTAEAYYHTIPGKSDAILPSKLLVLPTVEKVILNAKGEVAKRSVTTDNLAYAADFGGSPVFVVFPKGKRAVQEGLWVDVNLWEIPWGLAHEFGHHVFRTHTGVVDLGETSASAFHPIQSYEPVFDEDGLSLASSERAVTGEDIFGAINEGYADLYAHYVFGARAGLTKGVDCFDVSRDLTSPTFVDGRAKILDKDVIDLFFDNVAVPAKGCKAPNFQDIHAVGAVVAYGVERLFSVAVSDPTQKAALLLTWAKRMGDAVRGKDAAKITFQTLIKEALLTVAPDKKLSNAQCLVVKEQFPEYQAAWLAREFSCN